MIKSKLTELTLTDKERSSCECCLTLIEDLRRELNQNEYLEGQDKMITDEDLESTAFILNELRDTWSLYVMPRREE